MKQSKIYKQIDREIEKAFREHFNCVQIPIFDIPKIYKEAREYYHSGSISISDAVYNMAQRYKADINWRVKNET